MVTGRRMLRCTTGGSHSEESWVDNVFEIEVAVGKDSGRHRCDQQTIFSSITPACLSATLPPGRGRSGGRPGGSVGTDGCLHRVRLQRIGCSYA
jgi:hypothetical protein